jgi:hypothetical protein
LGSHTQVWWSLHPDNLDLVVVTPGSVPVSQPQARNIPPWPRLYVQYWHTCTICLVSSIHTIPRPSLRTHTSCICTHVPDPYTTVSFSTDPYAPVKLRGSALIPLLSYPIFMPKPSTHRMHDPGSIVPHIRPKVFTDNQMSRIKYNYYINNVSKHYNDSERNGTAEHSITPPERRPGQHVA